MTEMEQLASHLSFYSFHDAENQSQPELLDKQFYLCKFVPANPARQFLLAAALLPFGFKSKRMGLGEVGG